MSEVILILEPDGYSERALSIYRRLGRVERFEDGSYDDGEVFALVSRFAHRLDERFLARYANLRFIVSPTTGLNHVDSDYCARRGIDVISLKGESEFLRSVTATAELAFGMILSLVRNIHSSFASIVNEGRWDRDPFKGRELSGLTLGILGFGRLGRRVFEIAEAFGMKTLVCDPFVDAAVFGEYGAARAGADELFERSDVVTVHVDHRKENEKMIGEREFSLMKKGSWFVNTARGELVDEAALLDALAGGRLAGAAVDVLANENDREKIFDKPLVRYAREHANLIITPHIGGCTVESMRKTEDFCARKLEELVIGEDSK